MILPLAVVVGLCQLLLPADLIPSTVAAHLVPAHRDRVAWSEGRGEPATAAAPSDVNGSPDIAGTGGADGAGAAPPTAAPGPVRVLINHAAGTKNALPALQLATLLRERGFVVDNIRAVESEVDRPSVRYFFEGDQPDSHRLVEAVGAFLSQAPVRAPMEAEDFSHASPRAQRGRMEVWLPAMAPAAEHRPS